jgi:hypothetical protein
MPLTTPALFFARATNRLLASEYVEWAISMLEQDFDSPSLRILAGLDGSSLFEADDYFRRVLRELHISEPDFDTSVRAYACELCTRIISGTLDPKSGVRQLYKTCLATNYANDFMVWLYLDDGLDSIEAGDYPWTYEGLTPDNFEVVVRTEAKRFRETFCHDNVA